jgi:helix-turn-helix protein
MPSATSVVCWVSPQAGSMHGEMARRQRGRRPTPGSRSGFGRSSPAAYGAPRVHAELRALGVRCSRKRVALTPACASCRTRVSILDVPVRVNSTWMPYAF